MAEQRHKQRRWPRMLMVGTLVGLGIIGLLAVVFRLVSGISLLSSNIHIVAYVDDAAGLQKGAVVSLGGVRIGNVTGVSIPDSPPNPAQPVRIDMRVSSHQQDWLRENSLVQVATKGPMGDAAVSIDRGTADSPAARNGSVLPARVATPTSAVLISAHTLLENTNLLMDKFSAMVPHFKEGTAGKMMGPNDLSQRLGAISLQTGKIRAAMTSGSGSVARLMTDPRLPQALHQTEASTNGLQRQITRGNGSIGGFLHDSRLPKDLAGLKTDVGAASVNLKQAHGAVGKMMYDPSTVAELHGVMSGIDALGTSTGSIAQLTGNPELPRRTQDLSTSIHSLVKEMRANPHKFFRMHLDLF